MAQFSAKALNCQTLTQIQIFWTSLCQEVNTSSYYLTTSQVSLGMNILSCWLQCQKGHQTSKVREVAIIVGAFRSHPPTTLRNPHHL